MRPGQIFKALLLTALVTVAGPAPAQTEDAEVDPVSWSLQVRSAAAPSEHFVAELTAQIKRGWHLYSTNQTEGGPKPTRITFASGQAFTLNGEIDAPTPNTSFDPNFQVETEFYEDSVTFTIPFRTLPNSKAADKITVEIRYQSCTQTLCLPPKLITVEAFIPSASAGAKSTTSGTPAADRAPAALKDGAPVPEFVFTDFSGKARRFTEFRGRYVLLDFWASWCGPCLAEIPRLKEIYAKYQTRRFEIIGMNSEMLGQDQSDLEFAKSSQARAREIVSTRGIKWTQATTDTAVPVAVNFFGVTSLPVKVLIDPEGRILARIKDTAELDRALARIFGE